ncbi:MipA/OmpV family protein [Plasticicumulans sp.]|uniref:MipA/OmpV family protein n=1 Tax=Plasticicumulans sp. TaxID=2307179 RepID=UPI002BAD3E62|nr:MipA/OmpV family protein [Plasticicumulans sp.]HNI24107.1 MipA/OmpV family protein [Plasticicumulans sp.]HNJ09307.1 MipA/OmpV family protein [Plasticicumulans sp.]HNM44791.1 MipA/OmpV family protein [Plasticicumulans sp.]
MNPLPRCLLALAGCVPLPAAAEDLPLWELGAGLGVLSFNEYRGSSQRSNHVLPVPYFVYRGEVFKADRDGIRGQLFDGEHLRLNVSLGASVPVDSHDSGRRRGMPDLKATVEVGPALEIRLWTSADRKQRLELRLPARLALTVEGPPRDIGVVFSPNLNLDIDDPLGFRDWHLGLLAGPIYADARNHGYFYDVAPRYANAERPVYHAGAGYSGSRFLVAVSKRFPQFWVGGFARYDDLRGAVFEDSPLVDSRSSWAAGAAIAWVFDQSATRVPADDWRP